MTELVELRGRAWSKAVTVQTMTNLRNMMEGGMRGPHDSFLSVPAMMPCWEEDHVAVADEINGSDDDDNDVDEIFEITLKGGISP